MEWICYPSLSEIIVFARENRKRKDSRIDFDQLHDLAK